MTRPEAIQGCCASGRGRRLAPIAEFDPDDGWRRNQSACRKQRKEPQARVVPERRVTFQERESYVGEDDFGTMAVLQDQAQTYMKYVKGNLEAMTDLVLNSDAARNAEGLATCVRESELSRAVLDDDYGFPAMINEYSGRELIERGLYGNETHAIGTLDPPRTRPIRDDELGLKAMLTEYGDELLSKERMAELSLFFASLQDSEVSKAAQGAMTAVQQSELAVALQQCGERSKNTVMEVDALCLDKISRVATMNSNPSNLPVVRGQDVMFAQSVAVEDAAEVSFSEMLGVWYNDHLAEQLDDLDLEGTAQYYCNATPNRSNVGMAR